MRMNHSLKSLSAIASMCLLSFTLPACSDASQGKQAPSTTASTTDPTPIQVSLEAPDTINAGDIEVLITGLKSDEGTVRIGLYDDELNYKEGLRSFRHQVIPIESGIAKCTFESIPYGEYAITLYHDENENVLLDKRITGIPKESYGFSNNIKPKLGMPEFEKTKFVFNQNKMHQEIVAQ